VGVGSVVGTSTSGSGFLSCSSAEKGGGRGLIGKESGWCGGYGRDAAGFAWSEERAPSPLEKGVLRYRRQWQEAAWGGGGGGKGGGGGVEIKDGGGSGGERVGADQKRGVWRAVGGAEEGVKGVEG